MRRTAISAIVLALIGVLAIGGGVHLLTTDRVECGPRVLQPGETCESVIPRGRGTVVLDYEEQHASNRRVGYVALGFGLLALGYAGWLLRKPTAAANPPAPPAPPGPPGV
jgi:hypothetical protein